MVEHAAHMAISGAGLHEFSRTAAHAATWTGVAGVLHMLGIVGVAAGLLFGLGYFLFRRRA